MGLHQTWDPFNSTGNNCCTQGGVKATPRGSSEPRERSPEIEEGMTTNFFFWPHPQHFKVPRTESKPNYNLHNSCNLHHSWSNAGSFNLLCWARDHQ